MLSQLAWSQDRLGREIHSDPATVSRWLNGRVRPSKSTLGRIAHATQVDLQWLLTGEGRMRPHDELEPDGRSVRELLEMVSKVMASGSDYRGPLADSIRMFYRAMIMEEEMRGMEQEVMVLRTELGKFRGGERPHKEQRQNVALPATLSLGDNSHH